MLEAGRESQGGFSDLRNELDNYKEENNKLQDASMKVVKCNRMMLVALAIFTLVSVGVAVPFSWIWSASQDLDGLPLGTILAWVPRVQKSAPVHQSSIPEGWLLCDGRRIPQGLWQDGVTPDLNTARRFLRGGPEREALDLQEDQVKQHKHACSSRKSTISAHRHTYKESFHKKDNNRQ